MTAPSISCVIPTYENETLVAHCLASVAAQRDVAAEIILTDDSRSDRIAAMVAARFADTPGLRRVEGPRSGNPVDNWNAGLAAARAPLAVVVHQDESLIDPLYLSRAVAGLDRTRVVACVAGVRVLGGARGSRFGLIAPIAGRAPGARALLPMINWIGPTAAFVFRTGARFDPALVQLADVEFYGRVLARGGFVRLAGRSVESLGRHPDQISARIDGRALAVAEIDLLAARRPPPFSPLAYAVYRAALTLRAAL